MARITADYEELQMHKAVRDVTRLFERIQDYEKRIVKRRERLSREDFETLLEALALLARALAPLAPHIAEELLIALGGEDGPTSSEPGPRASSRRRRAAPRLLPVASAEAKNLEAIAKAIDQHNANCPFPAAEVRMNPFEVERLGWEEIRGLPIVARP